MSRSGHGGGTIGRKWISQMLRMPGGALQCSSSGPDVASQTSKLRPIRAMNIPSLDQNVDAEFNSSTAFTQRTSSPRLSSLSWKTANIPYPSTVGVSCRRWTMHIRDTQAQSLSTSATCKSCMGVKCGPLRKTRAKKPAQFARRCPIWSWPIHTWNRE